MPGGSGSGFFWGDDGHIVTNAHVVQRAVRADVNLADGRVLPARLIGTAPQYDLAVLQVDLNGVTADALVAGTSADLRVGQSVLAIGNPFGMDWTLTTGIVSWLDREIPIGNGVYRPPVLGIRFDPKINELARRNGIDGVVVLSVAPNGPADRAGLQSARRGRNGGLLPGDVI